MSKKMMSMLLTLLFTCFALFFGLGEFGLSEMFTKFDAVPLSDSSRNHIKPDTRLQRKGRKNQHAHPAE
jgi:hypothetical protein